MRLPDFAEWMACVYLLMQASDEDLARYPVDPDECQLWMLRELERERKRRMAGGAQITDVAGARSVTEGLPGEVRPL